MTNTFSVTQVPQISIVRGNFPPYRGPKARVQVRENDNSRSPNKCSALVVWKFYDNDCHLRIDFSDFIGPRHSTYSAYWINRPWVVWLSYTNSSIILTMFVALSVKKVPPLQLWRYSVDIRFMKISGERHKQTFAN